MMNIALVLCVLFANSSTTRGMRTIISEVGSNINITWTIYNRTDDLIYINHNNYTMIELWPEKKYSNSTPKYKDRLDFSFVKQDRELRMNLFLKNISYLDEGLYTSYILLHRKGIETVKVIVTGMRTIRSEAGSDINLTWTIYNRTDDLIYIDHNNNTIIQLWPEKRYSNPAPEYIDRLDFSFVKQGRDLRLNLLLKDISNLDEGLYTSYILLHRKEIETVKVIVTGIIKEPTVKDISRQQPDSTENKIELFCQLSNDSHGLTFWWINESLVVPDNKYVIFSNTLTIITVEESDQYDNFLCADDVNFIRSKAYRIRLGGPDNLTIAPTETIFHEFSALNITCLADCYLSCSFQWIKLSEFAVPKMLVSDSATIQIQNATRYNAGNYSCTAKNKITNKAISDNFTLEAIYGPDYITFAEVKREYNSMTDLNTVSCFADCHPPCRYSLLGPGVEIYSEESLHNITKNGTYMCQAINIATGKTSGASSLTISRELDHNDTRNSSTKGDTRNSSAKDTKFPDETTHIYALWTPISTYILIGIAVFPTCLICGFLVFKARKRCRIQSSNLSSNAKVSLPAVDLGNELEIVHIDIDPVSRYWTIVENSAGDLHSMMCETEDSGSPSVGTTSCLVYQNKPLENLEEISLQSVEDTYLSPI